MDAGEVVVDEVQGNRYCVVLNLFGERIGQAGEAAHGQDSVFTCAIQSWP